MTDHLTTNQTPSSPQRSVQDVSAASGALAEILLSKIAEHPEIYLVGIAGVPGSGKTTLCREISARQPNTLIVSMDGYHIPRCRLSDEGLRRRGALFTFDQDAFYADMVQLKRTRSGVFPGFDHAEKDPKPGAVIVTPDVPLVIVEGIYVLMHTWKAEPLFDLKVFLDCDPEVAVERLTHRHVATGLADTLEQGRQRAISNDLVNSREIWSDGCRERADLVLRTC